MLLQHLRADYAFPIPWPDESHFMWQSAALASDNTLFSEHLNPDRSILWMPPGFLVLAGLLFKVVGVSLAGVRWMSLLLTIGSFGMLAIVLREVKLALPALLIMAAVFLTPPVVAIANVARPEACVLILLCGSLWGIFAGRIWLALALSMLVPLIHPSGMLFLVALLIYLLLSGSFTSRRPDMSRTELATLAVVALCWFGYVIYAGFHWSEFIIDMGYQLRRKGGRAIWGTHGTAENALLLAFVTVGLLYAWRHRLVIGRFLVFALPGWFMMKLGNEMWYEPFYRIGMAIFVVLFLECTWHIVQGVLDRKYRCLPPILLAGVAIILLFWMQKTDVINRWSEYPYGAEWMRMRLSSKVPYYTNNDGDKIEHLLDSLGAGRDRLTVQVLPRADAFLMRDRVPKNVFLSDPIFCERKADVCLFHVSRYIPPLWERFRTEDLGRIGRKSLDEGVQLQLRDSTESWTYVLPADSL